MSDYKTIANMVFTNQAPTLKVLFATLFLDIYANIKDGIEVSDEADIEELRGYSEQLDLNAILRRFNHNHFGINSLGRLRGNNNFRFSLGDISDYLASHQLKNNPQIKKVVLRALEKKPYSVTQYSTYGAIAEEIVRWRNYWAHNDGFKNPSEALVLQSNIALILKIYPDHLQDKINGFDEYSEFINSKFLESILEILGVGLNQNIDEEIKAHFQAENSQLKINELANMPDDVDQQLSGISYDTLEIIEKVDQLNSNFDKIEGIIDSLSVQISTISSHPQFIRNDGLPSVGLVLNDVTLANNNQPSEEVYLNESNELTMEELDSVNIFLTNAEVLDSLMEMRQKIKSEMKKKYSDFQNWHNILMQPLSKQLVYFDIESAKAFKEDEIFQYYYTSSQIKGTLLEMPNLDERKQTAVKYMDEQLDRYWPDIQELLNKRPSAT